VHHGGLGLLDAVSYGAPIPAGTLIDIHCDDHPNVQGTKQLLEQITTGFKDCHTALNLAPRLPTNAARPSLLAQYVPKRFASNKKPLLRDIIFRLFHLGGDRTRASAGFADILSRQPHR
jgi:hypothetical protein